MDPKARNWLALIVLVSGSLQAAEVDSGLLDVAARIDYGWMTGDLALITAADETLAGRAGNAWSHYLRSYAAFRAAQLALANGGLAVDRLEDCNAEAEQAFESDEAAVEASVLLAACSAMASREQPLRAVLHQRRMRQGLEYAANEEPANPRLLLIAARYDPDGLIVPRPTAQMLLAAFRADESLDAFPNWGEAEAMTLVAEARLQVGDVRGARDLLEQALLIAPDYSVAIALRRRVMELATAQ
jgi:hypothetical protein